MGDLESPYRVSAAFLAGLKKAAESMKCADAWRAKLDPDAAAVFDQPQAKTWYPATTFEKLMLGLFQVGGSAGIREAGTIASHKQMGPIVKPLVMVTLAIAGGSPASLLSRTGNFVDAGIKGLKTAWQLTSPTTGVVTFEWPIPVPVYFAEIWYGLFDVGFTLSKPGKVVNTVIGPMAHRFELSWIEKADAAGKSDSSEPRVQAPR